jgi:hypothetical protein
MNTPEYGKSIVIEEGTLIVDYIPELVEDEYNKIFCVPLNSKNLPDMKDFLNIDDY